MEILNYRKQEHASISALFDLFFPKMGMTFHNLKLIKTKKGTWFVATPSYMQKDDAGENKFFPYISFNDEKGKDFQKAVLDLLEPFVSS